MQSDYFKHSLLPDEVQRILMDASKPVEGRMTITQRENLSRKRIDEAIESVKAKYPDCFRDDD